MSAKVFITGMGMISAIGNNVSENLQSLCSGQSGIGVVKYLSTKHTEIPVAEVKLSTEELISKAKISDAKGLTRTALLGMIAASEAYNNAGLQIDPAIRTGLISSTTVGGMGNTELNFKKYLDINEEGDFLNYINSHDCGESTERIADYLGITDFITTISTACSSSANAIMLGARLIKADRLDRVIVGGADALTKFTLNGFNTLMILDKNKCQPFDEKRNGLNLGEGAGYLVLESERMVELSKKEVLAEVKGYGNANDAYHQTASSPEGKGAYLAMKKALDSGVLQLSDIDYINVHGTGTLNNDLSEGLAIEKIFGAVIPKISSTKSYTGHTLAACGGIEAIYSILSIRNEMIFPNLNFSTQMKELSFKPETALRKNIPIRNVLSNSFGFGGNNSTVIFSKC